MPGRTSFQKEGPADTQHKGVSRRREGGPLGGSSQPRTLSCAEGQEGGEACWEEGKRGAASVMLSTTFEPTDVKAGHLDAE